jgi:microsomal dipeptidase-like Zn-dependent dipeptidase
MMPTFRVVLAMMAIPVAATGQVRDTAIRGRAPLFEVTARLSREYNLDFEDGLRGWTQTGTAFRSQPTLGDNVRTTDRVRASALLGGDYMEDLPYPVGHHGQYWIGTSDDHPSDRVPLGRTQGDAPVGTLTSGDVVLPADIGSFSYLIGGGRDARRLRLELQLRSAAGSRDESVLGADFVGRDGDYLVMLSATGNDLDVLELREFKLPRIAIGRRVRIKLIDSSSAKIGHINVDDLQFQAFGAVRDYRPKLWGFADYHAHPMAHVGFGALSGIRGMWGVPGTDASEYAARPELFARDLPVCSPGHNGGPIAPVFINEDEERYHFATAAVFQKIRIAASSGFRTHQSYGAPTFIGWPGFLTGAHQQYHITQIHRAWHGGLRLMSALAVNSQIAEFFLSPVSRRPRFGDRDVIAAHVCAMRQLATLNSAWMEIAYSPSDARRIIHDNKLAIVLGVEVDQLGNLGFSTPEEEVAFLWDLGVRQVTPIHAIDNDLGGAAVFLDGYNTANDLLRRRRRDADDLSGVDPVFFSIRDGGCVSGPDRGRRGECVGFRLDEEQNRAVQWNLPSALDFGAPTIPFTELINWEPYSATRAASASGHKNARGLTPQGQLYLSAMMDRGGIIDISHMSDLSASNAFRLSRARVVAAGRTECGPLTDLLSASDSCFDASYPFMASHVGFRSQMFARVDGRGPGTTKKEFVANEMNLSDSQAEMLRRLGGVIGPFLAQPPLDPPPDQPATPFANDCAMTTKGFGEAYLLALQKMSRSGIGFASDFAFHPTVFPRFGRADACNAKRLTASPDDEGERYPQQYQADAQRDGVLYEGVTAEERSASFLDRLRRVRPLAVYDMAGRSYDFNLDGLAHYGLVPDMLQDLKNIGVRSRDLEPLFASADDFVRMWEKGWRIAGCAASGGRCNPRPIALDCDRMCHGLCPMSPNAGAPVAR